MEALALGFVLHALACLKDGEGVVTHSCRELQVRSAPTSLYVCQRAMATAVERVASVPNTVLGLGEHSYHFVFSCEPAGGAV